jgi:hypothetical protein
MFWPPMASFTTMPPSWYAHHLILVTHIPNKGESRRWQNQFIDSTVHSKIQYYFSRFIAIYLSSRGGSKTFYGKIFLRVLKKVEFSDLFSTIRFRDTQSVPLIPRMKLRENQCQFHEG